MGGATAETANAYASVYVPHFMQENQQRIPGKPFELRVHVRMKNKDLVHVFSDLTEDQTFLSLRELCRKTFPTFGRRLSALEWHADGVRVCPSFMAGRMATLQQCGLADARRVEARVVYGRTNDRPPDAPADLFMRLLPAICRGMGLWPGRSTKSRCSSRTSHWQTGPRSSSRCCGDGGRPGSRDGGRRCYLDDAQLRRMWIDDRLVLIEAAVACCFGQLPGSITVQAAAGGVERRGELIRDAGPPLRGTALLQLRAVTSDAAGVQVRSLRRLDAEERLPPVCWGATAPGRRRRRPLPTARSHRRTH